MPFVPAWGEPDDDSAAIVGVALPAHKPGLLQPVEHPGDRSGGESCEIGELTSGRWTGALQNIHDLHIRDSHPDSGRRRPEERRSESIELPEFSRQLLEYLRVFFLRTT